MATMSPETIAQIKGTVMQFRNKIKAVNFTRFGFIDDFLMGSTQALISTKSDLQVAADISAVYNTVSWNTLAANVMTDENSFLYMEHLKTVLSAVLSSFLINGMVRYIGTNPTKMTMVAEAAREIVLEINAIMAAQTPVQQVYVQQVPQVQQVQQVQYPSGGYQVVAPQAATYILQ